ncbi:single-stranded DNA-binding protein [Mycoplasmopsis lipofaciens]|uniref:single-stranded DNA-binding protein n=1 Tax=Mycoplasmopsis lipofaciens TaxID=114884 RepID=UPI00068E5062|nr:single-stranded DNA-binding protein [Mycoplasmopsis lipofaciens]
MNKVLLVGRIANDVRSFMTPSGIPYSRTTIAVSRRTASSDNQTDFIPLVFWRSNSDFLTKYGGKGSLVSIEGTFTTSQYKKDNEIIRNYEVTVDNFSFLESRQVREERMGISSETSINVPNQKNQNTTSSIENKFVGKNDSQELSGFHKFVLSDDEGDLV